MILRTANVNAGQVVGSTLILLFTLQFFISPATFTTVGLIAMSVTFGYKSLAFAAFGWLLYRRKGVTALARTGRDFYWALFALAVLLCITFTMASIDRLTLPYSQPPITMLGEIRNVIRNFTIAAGLSVIIYASRFMDAVFVFIRDQANHPVEQVTA